MFAHSELIELKYLKQIIRLQAQGDLQLAQHTVIAQKMLWLRGALIAGASILDNQAVQEASKVYILTEYKVGFPFSCQPGCQFSFTAFIAAELKDRNHQLIAKIEDVAHTAQDIVIVDS